MTINKLVVENQKKHKIHKINEDVMKLVDASVTLQTRGVLYGESLDFVKKLYHTHHRQKLF